MWCGVKDVSQSGGGRLAHALAFFSTTIIDPLHLLKPAPIFNLFHTVSLTRASLRSFIRLSFNLSTYTLRSARCFINAASLDSSHQGIKHSLARTPTTLIMASSPARSTPHATSSVPPSAPQPLAAAQGSGHASHALPAPTQRSNEPDTVPHEDRSQGGMSAAEYTQLLSLMERFSEQHGIIQTVETVRQISLCELLHASIASASPPAPATAPAPALARSTLSLLIWFQHSLPLSLVPRRRNLPQLLSLRRTPWTWTRPGAQQLPPRTPPRRLKQQRWQRWRSFPLAARRWIA